MSDSAFDDLFRKPSARATKIFLRPNTNKVSSQNIVHKLRLWQRQRNCPNAARSNNKLSSARFSTSNLIFRKIYLNIYPKATHYQVEDEMVRKRWPLLTLKSVALRKFSPCGQYLIAFSRSTSIHSLEVYRLKPGVRSMSKEALESDQFVSILYFTRHFLENRWRLTTVRVLKVLFLYYAQPCISNFLL